MSSTQRPPKSRPSDIKIICSFPYSNRNKYHKAVESGYSLGQYTTWKDLENGSDWNKALRFYSSPLPSWWKLLSKLPQKCSYSLPEPEEWSFWNALQTQHWNCTMLWRIKASHSVLLLLKLSLGKSDSFIQMLFLWIMRRKSIIDEVKNKSSWACPLSSVPPIRQEWQLANFLSRFQDGILTPKQSCFSRKMSLLLLFQKLSSISVPKCIITLLSNRLEM